MSGTLGRWDVRRNLNRDPQEDGSGSICRYMMLLYRRRGRSCRYAALNFIFFHFILNRLLTPVSPFSFSIANVGQAAVFKENPESAVSDGVVSIRGVRVTEPRID